MMIEEFRALEKLNPLVGQWRSEGEVLATSTTPAIRISGTDIHEWVCDGKFLLHRVEVIMGNETVKVIEMIGYEPEADRYPMRSFDNKGNFTTMYSVVDEDGVWKIYAEGMRSTLTIDKDRKTMKAYWKQSADGVAWNDWMEMRFRKR